METLRDAAMRCRAYFLAKIAEGGRSILRGTTHSHDALAFKRADRRPTGSQCGTRRPSGQASHSTTRRSLQLNQPREHTSVTSRASVKKPYSARSSVHLCSLPLSKHDTISSLLCTAPHLILTLPTPFRGPAFNVLDQPHKYLMVRRRLRQPLLTRQRTGELSMLYHDHQLSISPWLE